MIATKREASPPPPAAPPLVQMYSGFYLNSNKLSSAIPTQLGELPSIHHHDPWALWPPNPFASTAQFNQPTSSNRHSTASHYTTQPTLESFFSIRSPPPTSNFSPPFWALPLRRWRQCCALLQRTATHSPLADTAAAYASGCNRAPGHTRGRRFSLRSWLLLYVVPPENNRQNAALPVASGARAPWATLGLFAIASWQTHTTTTPALKALSRSVTLGQ